VILYFANTVTNLWKENHFCFINVDIRKPDFNDFVFIFYDLETRQERTIYQKQYQDVKLNEPNLCVLSTRCHHCIDESKLFFCLNCGYRTMVFKTKVISSFVDYILKIAKKNSKKLQFWLIMDKALIINSF